MDGSAQAAADSRSGADILQFPDTTGDLGPSTQTQMQTYSVVQPLTGELAGLFGRRYVALSVVALYIIGSGVAGGAGGRAAAMLIAGRAVQGAGSGGMTAVMGVVSYQAIIAMTYAVGMAIGPVVGGAIVQNTTWRWVFYISLPVGGVSISLLWLAWDKLKRIDVVGNSPLVAPTVSVLIALTWAGSTWIAEPVMPLRLFANRTSAVIYINTFIVSILNYWIFFFLPLYFQAVQLSTTVRSGVQILPITLIAVPGAPVGAVALSKWGKYKLLHIISFAFLTAGIGSLSVLTKNSSTAEWVCFEILPSVCAGMVLDTLLPAFQVGVSEADSAASAASWSFVRSFGNIWGLIGDPTARSSLQNGDAYSSATRDFIGSFPEPTRGQLIEVFTRSLRNILLVGIVFPALAFALSFVEREVKIRTILETEFGLEDREKPKPRGKT
ncbi:major facilitator superfamily domain-containing protein [Xylariomycetidae sp. FL2044]|nr:major facilitator superfamily domain-containing protein [Xylariomycetidae sp. FL2044]